MSISTVLSAAALASLTVFVPAVGLAADSDRVDCHVAIPTTAPIVADRVERALQECETRLGGPSSSVPTLRIPPAPALTECIRIVRQTGLRTADRLDAAVAECLAR
jgi:hypothetical protein